MPMFEYKAYTPEGKTVKNLVEADSAKTARTKLKKQRLIVIEIRERAAGRVKKGTTSSSLFAGKVSVKDMAMMVRQLSSLIKANIPLVEALSAMVEQSENEKLKVILSTVRQDVNEGSSLAKAMSKHPKAFDNIFINMVEAGETSGTLGLVMLKIADLKERQMRLRSKIISAMTYPALMMAVGTMLVLAIFTIVIPKLTKVFDSMNKTIPPTTEALILISDFMVNYWYALVIGFFILSAMFKKYINSDGGKPKWHRFMLRAPIFGSLFRAVAVTRFASTMGTLLQSGVPIVAAMGIAKKMVGNVNIEVAIEEAISNIEEGASIADPLKRSGEFPPLVIHMIAIGERTGDLPEMLATISTTYEEQVNNKIEGMTALLEPVMIIVMGGFVGFVVMAIFVPLLEISNVN